MAILLMVQLIKVLEEYKEAWEEINKWMPLWEWAWVWIETEWIWEWAWEWAWVWECKEIEWT